MPVYFIRPVGMDGPVKIGGSGVPKNRLNNLMTWSPFPLEVAATDDGGYPLERRIARQSHRPAPQDTSGQP